MNLAERLLVFALVALPASCVDGRRLTSSSPEYELYRQTRVAATLEERLSSAWEYLDQYPEGEFRSDVRAWFQSAEADYFVYAGPSRLRLRRYLATLPDGPHAEEARVRLAELEQARLSATQKEALVLDRARAVSRELERAEDARKQFISLVSQWVSRLAPTPALDSGFLEAFKLEPPTPTCDDQRCVKQFTLTYAIPDAGRSSERVAVFDVILTFVDGAVRRGELMGPDLFSRLGEATQRLAVPVEDGQRRAEAIGAAQQLIAGVLEPSFPPGSCAREAVSPVVLERECRGVRIQMVAALDVGGEDRVVFEPVLTKGVSGPARR